eukprot:gene6860-8194_t
MTLQLVGCSGEEVALRSFRYEEVVAGTVHLEVAQVQVLSAGSAVVIAAGRRRGLMQASTQVLSANVQTCFSTSEGPEGCVRVGALLSASILSGQLLQNLSAVFPELQAVRLAEGQETAMTAVIQYAFCPMPSQRSLPCELHLKFLVIM